MKNNFEFSYFKPSPDTTANCALSRWNDGLLGLSDFIKDYMSCSNFSEFGFSRSLNISELVNLINVDNLFNTYILDYIKHGDIKAKICGFEVPIVCRENPFIFMDSETRIIDEGSVGESDDVFEEKRLGFFGIGHIHNYQSELTAIERISASITAFQALEADVTNMSDGVIVSLFSDEVKGSLPLEQTPTYIKQTVLSYISDIIDYLSFISSKQDPLEGDKEKIIFYYDNWQDFNKTSLNSNELDGVKPFYRGSYYDKADYNSRFFDDVLYYSSEIEDGDYPGDPTKNILTVLKLPVFQHRVKEIQEKYFYPNGIEASFIGRDIDGELAQYPLMNCNPYTSVNSRGHLILRFRFSLIESPTVAPFLSHDGTKIPLSMQKVNIQCSFLPTEDLVIDHVVKCCSMWNSLAEAPEFIYSDGHKMIMTLEEFGGGICGRDYTIWSSPVQKTGNGYQFDVCLPIAFYNSVTHSYSSEYYALESHPDVGVDVGEVLYRVPVFKMMRQNIEEAVVNTHLTKCLGSVEPVDENNYEDEENVVLGGVIVDDFTDGLYPRMELQSFASTSEYGEVKTVNASASNLNLMYHYSRTGELEFNGNSMPTYGRAIDMITMFDVLKKLHGDQPITSATQFLSSDLDLDRFVTAHSASSETTGENQDIYGVKTFKNNVVADDIYPTTTGTGSIGSTTNRYATANVNELALQKFTMKDEIAIFGTSDMKQFRLSDDNVSGKPSLVIDYPVGSPQNPSQVYPAVYLETTNSYNGHYYEAMCYSYCNQGTHQPEAGLAFYDTENVRNRVLSIVLHYNSDIHISQHQIDITGPVAFANGVTFNGAVTTTSTTTLNSLTVQTTSEFTGEVDMKDNATVEGNLYTRGDIYTLGTQKIGDGTAPFGSIYVRTTKTFNIESINSGVDVTAKANIVPDGTSTLTLGTSSYKWEHVYANYLHGITPNVNNAVYNSNPAVEVGSIILIAMFASSQFGTDTSNQKFPCAGEVIESGLDSDFSGTPKVFVIYPATFSNGAFSSNGSDYYAGIYGNGRLFYSGIKFKLLSDVNSSYQSGNTNGAIALAIVVEMPSS